MKYTLGEVGGVFTGDDGDGVLVAVEIIGEVLMGERGLIGAIDVWVEGEIEELTGEVLIESSSTTGFNGDDKRVLRKGVKGELREGLLLGEAGGLSYLGGELSF